MVFGKETAVSCIFFDDVQTVIKAAGLFGAQKGQASKPPVRFINQTFFIRFGLDNCLDGDAVLLHANLLAFIHPSSQNSEACFNSDPEAKLLARIPVHHSDI